MAEPELRRRKLDSLRRASPWKSLNGALVFLNDSLNSPSVRRRLAELPFPSTLGSAESRKGRSARRPFLFQPESFARD